MTTKNPEVRNRLDSLKWMFIVTLIVVGIGANYYFYSQPLAYRLIGWLVLVLVAMSIAYYTVKGQVLLDFLKEARIELRKIVWPNRQETVQTTLVVIVMVVIVGLFLWGVDAILLWAIGHITG